MIAIKEVELQEKFKSIIQSQGFSIVHKFIQTSPDLIIEKEGRKIGVELKGSRNTTVFASALGQLLYSKFKYNLDELWLVLAKQPSSFSRDWIELLQKHNISIFFFSSDKFVKFTLESFRVNRKNPLEIDKNILNLLQSFPEGLGIREIARALDITEETVKNHIEGGGILNKFSILKGKIKVENDKISL